MAQPREQRKEYAKFRAMGLSIEVAAKKAGVHTRTGSNWEKREDVNEWKAEFIATDTFNLDNREKALAELFRRAVEGWLEPVFFRGDKCGEVRKYCGKSLELYLKATYPERFSGNFTQFELPVSGTPDEQLNAILEAQSEGRLNTQQAAAVCSIIEKRGEWVAMVTELEQLRSLLNTTEV